MPSATFALLLTLYSVQAFREALTPPCNNATQFDCGTTSRSKRCIPLEWLCDGLKDCKNGLDESHCSYLHKCPSRHFICRTGECVSGKYRCDGEVDCPGGEDERGCESGCDDSDQVVAAARLSRAKTATGLCKAGEHRCSGGKVCIAFNRICDGTSDCPDGSDEGPLCNECSTRKTPCDYKCVDTPRELSPDKHTCSQINQCKTPGAKQCQHYCEERRADYECKCANGYHLGLDGHSCRLKSHEGTLLVALEHEVRSMPLFDSLTFVTEYETIQDVGSLGMVRSMDYHTSEQLIYAAIVGSNSIGVVAVSFKGHLRVIRENLAGIGQVAVNWPSGNIFITQSYPSLTPGISVCTKDGFFCRRIIKGKSADPIEDRKKQQYRGLALHPQRGVMVWIESYGNHRKIVSANMDGTNVRNLVESKLYEPNGLSIDFIRRDIYFGVSSLIERVNMDTGERTVVLTLGVRYPYDIRYFNGFLYWTDRRKDALKVSELSIHHKCTRSIRPPTSFPYRPYGLAINHSMFQPSFSNPCSNGCSHICVPISNAENEVTPQCLCPDGYDEEKNGECAPLGDIFGEDEPDNPLMKKNEFEDQSHMGVAWMRERCLEGDGCLNGGQCHDIKNEHGRVIKIVCKCKTPYEGLRCEWLNPVKAQLRLSAIEFWIMCFIIFLLVIFSIAIVVFSYHHIYKINKHASSLASIEKTVKFTSIISKPLFDEDQLSYESKEEPDADTVTRNPAISAKSGRIGSDLDVSERIVEHQYCTIAGC